MSQSSKTWASPPVLQSSPVSIGGVALEDILDSVKKIKQRQDVLFRALDKHQRTMKLLEIFLDQLGPEARDALVKANDAATDADLTAHTGDTTIHFTEGSIDHTAITNIGTNAHSVIDTHLGDAGKHREIADGATGATDLWSASKINTEVGAKVAKSTFNANTILKADSDDTPAALAVALSTVVGRYSAGNIEDLSMAQLSAMLGTAAGLEVAAPFALSSYIDINTNRGVQNIHGGLVPLVSAQQLDVGNDVTFDTGISKLLIVVNTKGGGVYTGDILVSGDTVDRDDQTPTVGDSETLTLAGATSDNSAADSNGIDRYVMVDAYMTSKWFAEDITISTAGSVDCTIDVYQCAFEQLNDDPDATVHTLDIIATLTNTLAWLSAHLYHVDVDSGSNKVALTPLADATTAASTYVADTVVRLRQSGIDTAIPGTRDGIFLQLALGPTSNSWWENISVEIWCTTTTPVTAV